MYTVGGMDVKGVTGLVSRDHNLSGLWSEPHQMDKIHRMNRGELVVGEEAPSRKIPPGRGSTPSRRLEMRYWIGMLPSILIVSPAPTVTTTSRSRMSGQERFIVRVPAGK